MTDTGTAAMAQTLLWLMVVVGLILALAWAARRFSVINALGGQGMKVLSALPVGNRERVVLVQVGDKQVLLGVAPGQVSLLHVFDEPVVPAPVVPGSGVPGAGGSKASRQQQGFQSVLRNVVNRKP